MCTSVYTRVCVGAQSCPTLCDSMDCSLPGSSVHGIFQAGILEWAVISSFKGSSRPKDQTHVFCISCIGRQLLYHWAHILECAYHQKFSFNPSLYSWCPLPILAHSPILFPLVTTRKWSSRFCLPWFIRKPRCPTVGIPSITEQGKVRCIRSNTTKGVIVIKSKI